MKNEKDGLFIDRQLTTVLKGYSVLTVIFGHMISCTGIFDSNSLVFNRYFRDLICPTDVGMGLFLFLSGYGLYQSYKKRGLSQYWESKIKRVWLPFFCVQIVWWIHAYFTTGLIWPKEERVLSLLGIWPHDVFDGSMWYISYQFFWYFVFFVCFFLFKERGLILIGLVSIACCMNLGNLWMAYNDRFCFLAGLIFAVYETQITKNECRHKYKVLIVSVIVIILCRVWYLNNNCSAINNLLLPIIVFCYILIGKFSAKQLIHLTGFLHATGKISYSLYLLEMKLIVDLSVFLVYRYDVEKYWALIYMVLFALTVLLACLLTKAFEKIDTFCMRGPEKQRK